MVFPGIVKAGFLVGAEYGTGGALFKSDGTAGYYKILAGSYGFQAGMQSFSYTFIFDQKGLMAGLGLQGSKINRINPD